MSHDPEPSRDYRAFEAGVRALAASLTPLPVRDDVVERLYNKHCQEFDASRLYYEAHITIKPELDIDARTAFSETLVDLAKGSPGWKAASFLMVKGDDKKPDAFMTYRGESQVETIKAVRVMRDRLEQQGFTVMRWKIEDTLLDTKHGDEI